MTNAGFSVNPELVSFYNDHFVERTGVGFTGNNFDINEPAVNEYSDEMIANAKAYSDVAVFVVSRLGGEGADLPMDMDPNATTHIVSSGKDIEQVVKGGDAGKHYLELQSVEQQVLDIDYMAKKNTKHGFTLVELIVVLVILAILAALLIPALTGYIDKARKSQVVAETRALTQAVQTEMSTVYALNDEFQRQKSIGKNLTIASKDDDYGEGKGQLDDKLKERYAEIIHLSEVPILEKELESTTGKSSFFAIINKKGAVQWTVYNNGKGYIGIYCGDEGETAAFKEDEAPNYAYSYGKFLGKIIYLRNENDEHWTKKMVYACMGIKGYDFT